MVTNLIYEGPQYEIVHPELNTLTASHQTADAVASVDNPFYQAVLMKWPKHWGQQLPWLVNHLGRVGPKAGLLLELI